MSFLTKTSSSCCKTQVGFLKKFVITSLVEVILEFYFQKTGIVPENLCNSNFAMFIARCVSQQQDFVTAVFFRRVYISFLVENAMRIDHSDPTHLENKNTSSKSSQKLKSVHVDMLGVAPLHQGQPWRFRLEFLKSKHVKHVILVVGILGGELHDLEPGCT